VLLKLSRLACVVILALVLAGCQKQELFSNVSQRDANDMIVALERAGITASIKPAGQPGRVALEVDSDQVAIASSVLRRVGLPRPEKTPLTDLLPKDSWMASRNQENVRLAYGMGQDLSSTLTQINGVREARVHIALAQKNAIGSVETAPSASVLVRYDSRLLDPEFRNDIAALISNAVPGLSYDRVAVTMVPETIGVSSLGDNPGVVGAAADTFAFWIRIIALFLLVTLLTWFLYTLNKRRSA
jgi:type III secretion protein J